MTSIVCNCRNLAAQGKTIVATIHQPSSQVFEMFDRLMLLAEGRLAYIGTTSGAESFFQSAGFKCPRNYNPADHYLKALAINLGEESKCRQRVEKICKEFDHFDKGRITGISNIKVDNLIHTLTEHG